MAQIEEDENKADYPHAEITKEIIGAAIEVLNDLRPGLDEKVYENALVIELRDRGHVVYQQKAFPIYFKKRHIGTLIPDLIVDDAVIVDAKVTQAFTDVHISQMIGYLTITGLKVALLINFKFDRLQFKRVVK